MIVMTVIMVDDDASNAIKVCSDMIQRLRIGYPLRVGLKEQRSFIARVIDLCEMFSLLSSHRSSIHPTGYLRSSLVGGVGKVLFIPAKVFAPPRPQRSLREWALQGTGLWPL